VVIHYSGLAAGSVSARLGLVNAFCERSRRRVCGSLRELSYQSQEVDIHQTAGVAAPPKGQGCRRAQELVLSGGRARVICLRTPQDACSEQVSPRRVLRGLEPKHA
jgi:hypothetical protein